MSPEGDPHQRSGEIFESAHGPKDARALAREVEENESFDKKWQEVKSIPIGEKEYRLYRVRPEHFASEMPTLVVPGWAATPEVYKENMRAIVSEGVEALSVDASHGAEHSITPSEEVGGVADAELRRINAFMSGLDSSDIKKVDAIGHSEGGLDVLLAAAMYPERFNTIVLVNPAGMIENFNLRKLITGFSLDAVRSWYFAYKQGTMAEKKRQDKLSAPAIFGDPVQAGKEVLSMSTSKVYQLLRYVSEAGVDVIIVHGPQDKVFPFTDMASTIQNQKMHKDEDITHLLKGVYSVKGDHNSFIRNAATYTRLATGAIKARALAKRERN